jgi:hypothetical protein
LRPRKQSLASPGRLLSVSTISRVPYTSAAFSRSGSLSPLGNVGRRRSKAPGRV